VRRGTTRRYKVTLVGLGAMGQRHARVLRDLERRFEVVGAYDVRGDAPTPAGVDRLHRESEALARAEIVVVATPIETHAGIVTRALAAGRHVFVEKPMCATAAEAHVAGSAARHGARLFVGHSERFNPVIRTLAKLVRDDRILAIDLRRVGPSRPCGCGVLVNLGVHDFDLAAYLGGGRLVIRGAMGFGSSDVPGEDAAHVLLSTATGASGHLYVDRTVTTKQRVIELATSRWVYRGDLLAHRLVRTSRSVATPADVPLPLDEPLAAQALALADALDGASSGDPRREIAVGADGVRALEAAETASAYCAASVPAENLSLDARR
jgi:predicted dehydrogenase